MRKNTIIYLDKNTRIKLKFHLPALSFAFCMQRRRKYWWKTVSWVYPSIMRNKERTFEQMVGYLKWEEEQKKTEFKIGSELLNSGWKPGDITFW